MSDPVRVPHKMNLPYPVGYLSYCFSLKNKSLYVVGGAVRDSLLGQKPKDFDLATDALPDEIIAILSDFYDFEEQGGKPTIIEVGKAFGVIKAVFPPVIDFGTKFKSIEIEIATFRSDVGAGRRPDSVEFTSIEQDVLRRDLTINALFYDISKGEVVDYVGGIADLKNQVVRTVGKPFERFEEDRLRILRAIRFAAQMGCELEIDTLQAIQRDPSLRGVSPERIRDEFLKCIDKTKSVTHLFFLLTRLGLWEAIFPGHDVIASNVREIREPMLLLALVLVMESTEDVSQTLHELKYTVDEIKQFVFLRQFILGWENRSAIMLHKMYVSSKLSESSFRRFAGLFGRPPKYFIDAFLEYRPTVKGETLLSEGFQGKELGLELEKRELVLFDQLLDDHRLKTSIKQT
jgi:tRNA nucleotidyltransferase/poly(A) polymerase